MKRDSEMTRAMAEEGTNIVTKYLRGELEGSEKIRIALSAVQSHIKMKATEANDDTNRLGLAKLVYSDEKEMASYIKKSMPHLMIEKK